MTNLSNIVQAMESLGIHLLQKGKLNETKKLFIPRLFLLYVSGKDNNALLRQFYDWKQRAVASGNINAYDLTFLDLDETELPMPYELKCIIIKQEISFCRKNPKYNNIRKLLIDKFTAMPICSKIFFGNSIFVRLENIWMGYFDIQSSKTQLFSNCESIKTDLEKYVEDKKGAQTDGARLFLAIVYTWLFLLKIKVPEQKFLKNDHEKQGINEKLTTTESNSEDEHHHTIGHLVSIHKDLEMLRYLKNAHHNFEQSLLQNDYANLVTNEYLSIKLILDCLCVLIEAFRLMGEFEFYEKSLQLLIRYSDKHECSEFKVNAICDLLSNNIPIKIELKKEILAKSKELITSNKR